MLPYSTIKPANVTIFNHSLKVLHQICSSQYMISPVLVILFYYVLVGQRHKPFLPGRYRCSVVTSPSWSPIDVPSIPLLVLNRIRAVYALDSLINVGSVDEELKGSVSRIKGPLQFHRSIPAYFDFWLWSMPWLIPVWLEANHKDCNFIFVLIWMLKVFLK